MVRTKQLIDQLEKQGGNEQVTPSQGCERRFQTVQIICRPWKTSVCRSNLKKLIPISSNSARSKLQIPAQIAKYQRWIEAVPVREAEWNALTRDYTELRRHYDQLVAQNLQAQSAENLEHSQKGSKFKIVDSARLPEKPFQPKFFENVPRCPCNRVCIGFRYLFVLDFIDTSFKDVGELEEYIGVPVICAIPLH